MDVDALLAWSATVPGRHELVDGEVFAMAPIGATIEARIVNEGSVALDPPGIPLAVADLFGDR